MTSGSDKCESRLKYNSSPILRIAIQCFKEKIDDGSHPIILDEFGTFRMNPKAAEGLIEFTSLKKVIRNNRIGLVIFLHSSWHLESILHEHKPVNLESC